MVIEERDRTKNPWAVSKAEDKRWECGFGPLGPWRRDTTSRTYPTPVNTYSKRPFCSISRLPLQGTDCSCNRRYTAPLYSIVLYGNIENFSNGVRKSMLNFSNLGIIDKVNRMIFVIIENMEITIFERYKYVYVEF